MPELSDTRYANQADSNQPLQRALYSNEQMPNSLDEMNSVSQSRLSSDTPPANTGPHQSSQPQSIQPQPQQQPQQHTPSSLNLLPELSVMDIESQLFEFETDEQRNCGGIPSVSESASPVMSGDLVSPKTATSNSRGGAAFLSFNQQGQQQESSAAGYLSGSPIVQQQTKALNSPHDMIPRTPLHSCSAIKPTMGMQHGDLMGPQECDSPKSQIVQQREPAFPCMSF